MIFNYNLKKIQNIFIIGDFAMKRIFILSLIFYSVFSLSADMSWGPYIGRTAEFSFEELKMDSGRTRFPEVSVAKCGKLTPFIDNDIYFTTVSIYDNNIDYYLTPVDPNDLLSYGYNFPSDYSIKPYRFGDIDFNLQLVDKNSDTIYSGIITIPGIKEENTKPCTIELKSNMGEELFANSPIEISTEFVYEGGNIDYEKAWYVIFDSNGRVYKMNSSKDYHFGPPSGFEFSSVTIEDAGDYHIKLFARPDSSSEELFYAETDFSVMK